MVESVEALRRERDIAIADLQSWQRRYEFLFSNMLTGYAYHDMVLDADDRPVDYIFVEVNQTFEDLTGLKAAEIVGRRVTEVLPGIEHSEFDWIGAYGEVAMGGDPLNFDQFSEQLGRWFHVTAYSPHRRSFVAVFHDITARKRTEEELARKEEQLQQAQKLEVIGRLAGSIAHDFNNALTAVLGHAELIRNADEHDEIRRRARAVIDTARRAAVMTQRLLAFGRRQTVAPLAVDLTDALAATADLLGPLLSERVTLQLQFTDEPAAVEIDPTQLQQIVMNLLINGAHAMGDAGHLVLRTAVVDLDGPPGDLGAGAVGPGRWAEISVVDQGKGMDEETLSRIFEPFFTTKADHGTGLGLSTVGDIAAAAGGGVAVRSTPGAGTTFRVYLPWREVGASDEQSRSVELQPAPEGGRDLVLVEDEPLVRELLEGILTRAGYRVRAMPSAEDTLEADLGRLDALVTDVRLPGMSGPELADQLGQRYAGLRVVFTSGYQREELAHELGDEVRFLHKPFAPSQMLGALADLLG